MTPQPITSSAPALPPVPPSKSIFASKTIWGILIVTLGSFFPGALAKIAPDGGDALANTIAQIAGLILILYGRLTAIQPLHLVPGQSATEARLTQLESALQTLINPPPPSPPGGSASGFINSRLFAAFGFLGIASGVLISVLLSACNSTQLATVNAAAAKVTPDQVTMAASVVNVATKDGVQLLLKKHPNYSADVILADKALNAFVAAGNTDPLALRTAIDAAIPVADQAEAQPVIDGTVALYSSYVTPWLASLDPGTAKVYALQLLAAVDGGLNSALAPQ